MHKFILAFHHFHFFLFPLLYISQHKVWQSSQLMHIPMQSRVQQADTKSNVTSSLNMLQGTHTCTGVRMCTFTSAFNAFIFFFCFVLGFLTILIQKTLFYFFFFYKAEIYLYLQKCITIFFIFSLFVNKFINTYIKRLKIKETLFYKICVLLTYFQIL